MDLHEDFAQVFPLRSIEDPFSVDDFEGFVEPSNIELIDQSSMQQRTSCIAQPIRGLRAFACDIQSRLDEKKETEVISYRGIVKGCEMELIDLSHKIEPWSKNPQYAIEDILGTSGL